MKHAPDPNAPTALDFAKGGCHQVPPGDRKDWEHDYYSNKCGFVRFRHKETGETVVCPNMWYNGTPEASIHRRLLWIEEGKEREKYWEAQRPSYERDDNLKHIRKMRQVHLETIERIKHTGEVL